MKPRSRTGLAVVVLVALLASGRALLADRQPSSGTTPRPTPAQAAATFPVDATPVARLAPTGVPSYADMLDKVTPAVVSIYPAKIVRVDPRRRSSQLEELLRRYYGLPTPQVPDRGAAPEERRVVQGMGSGVIISPDGYLLTNNHVITDERGQLADEILVRLNDERELVATVVGTDPRTDVAVLKVEATGLPSLPLAESANLRVGDVVFAVGNPLEVGLTVTMGIVSATGRSQLGILGEQGYEDFIQTDASINPGNSGGALVDAAGRLVGINTAIFSRTGGNIGIGFAIPISLARTIAVSLITTGEVQRGFLGVSIRDLTPDLAESFGLPATQRGALVQGIEEGLPAANAGIQRGDIITRVGERRVGSVADLRLAVASTTPGAEVEIVAIRDGKEQRFTAVMGNLASPRATASGAAATGAGEVLPGLRAESVSPALRAQFSLPDNLEGLVVTEVRPDSPVARTPLRVGMVVIEVNGVAVSTPEAAREALRAGPNRFWVFDGRNFGYVVVRVVP